MGTIEQLLLYHRAVAMGTIEQLLWVLYSSCYRYYRTVAMGSIE